jgi:hypothetical protein
MTSNVDWAAPGPSFKVNAFCKDLAIGTSDEILTEFQQLFNATSILLSDAYSTRAYFWGVASALENQIQYLGSNYLPNLERRVNTLEGTGYLSEGDLQVDWFANEDKPHVNDDTDIETQASDVRSQIDVIQERMRTLAIGYVLAVREHDDISKDLQQLTYGAIKSRAAAKRAKAA